MRPLLLSLAFLAACASTDRPSSAPPGSYLAVLDKTDATLRLIEPNSGTLKDLVSTGNGPHECAIAPDGEILVVCNYGDQQPGHTLTVWDLSERRVRATIDLSPHQRPHGIQFLSRRRALVTSETSRAVLEVDLARERVVRALDTGADTSHMLAIARDGDRVFTANIRSGTVSVIDLASGGLVASIPTGAQPEAIAVSPDGREVWVGHNQDEKLVVLDAHSLDILAELPCGRLPIRLAFTPDGSTVLVSCALSGEIAVIDRAARRETARIALPPRSTPDGTGDTNPLPIGIVVETKGRYAYVSLSAADRVAVIDLEQRAVVRTFETGRTPDGIAWIWRRKPYGFLGEF